MRRRHLLVLAAVGVLPLVGCEPSDPAVERVSETNSGGTPNAPSYAPAISDNGRWVAFVSDASNIGFEFKDGVADVFVHDQSTDLTFSITTSGNGPSGWAPSCSTFEASSGCSDNPSQPEAPAISDDGGTVAFTSFATNLAGPVAAVPNVYAHRDGSGPMLASRSSAGAPANGPSFGVAVSGNGRFVSFWSYASNLVPGDTNESPDVFVHDLDTGATTRVNTTATGGQSGPSEETFETDSLGSELLSAYQPAPLSDDGRYVAFLSTRTDLAPGGSPRGNVYRKDRQTGAVIRVSDPALGDRAEAPFISADGNLVSFLT
ncbi:MAG: domain protein beta Propeller, partial [Acidimicrobiales bacterium]|nr:domain protein beta Propeller [Acidimicrobiales bacterium]